MCDKNGCAKCYHVNCLELEKKPHGRWLCPWHFCDICGKRATIMCSECPNSYCKPHAEGQISCTAEGQYLCEEHNLSDTPKQDTKPEMETVNSILLQEDLPDGLPEITSIHLQDLPQTSQDFEQAS